MKIFSGTSQGGSVANFLVIGIVLIALAAGGVYFLQQREAETPAKQPAVPIAPTEQAEKQKKSGNQNQTKKKPSNKSTKSQKERKNAALPQTGPADSLAVILASAVLAGLSVAYIRSILYRFGYIQS